MNIPSVYLCAGKVDASKGDMVAADPNDKAEARAAKTLAHYKRDLAHAQREAGNFHDGFVNGLIAEARDEQVKSQLESYKADLINAYTFAKHLVGAGVPGAETFSIDQVRLCLDSGFGF